MDTLAHQTIQTPSLLVHALSCGKPGRPLVLMLHGFPQLCYAWTDVMPHIAEAGFYVVAPDLRGYGGTTLNGGGTIDPKSLDIDQLAADVVEMIHSLGYEKAHVVGHDSGGAVAYHVAAQHPEVVDRLAVVNAPHPVVMAKHSWRPEQLLRSSYLLFFQLPRIPELVASAWGGEIVARSMRALAVDKRHFSRERLAPMAANMARPEAAKAAIGYYRQILRRLLTAKGLRNLISYPKIQAPFRLIWSEHDQLLGINLTDDMEPYFARAPDIAFLPNVGHYAPIEAPELVGQRLVEHLAVHPVAAVRSN